ncbi:MAG: enoyl-CoA hydratase-related protein [Novosphingobium sp.]
MSDAYSKFAGLSIALADHVLTLTMDNPPVNAMTAETHFSLATIWDQVGNDPDVRCVVITGAGDRAFSAGGSLQGMIDHWGDHGRWQIGMAEARALILGMLSCPKPIISRINGHAMGLGASIALSADITIAVDEAKIGDPHVGVGLTAGDGGALLWPNLVGLVEARRYLLSGDPLTGKEAAAKGLITGSVPREALDTEVKRWTDNFLSKSPVAIQTTKQALNLDLVEKAKKYLGEMLRLETKSWESPHHLESVRALLEKRQPVFGND